MTNQEKEILNSTIIFFVSCLFISLIKIDNKLGYSYFFNFDMGVILFILACFFFMYCCYSLNYADRLSYILFSFVMAFIISYPVSSSYIENNKEEMIKTIYERNLGELIKRNNRNENSGMDMLNSTPYKYFLSLNDTTENRIKAIEYIENQGLDFYPASVSDIYDLSLLSKFTNDLVIKAKIEEIYKDGYISVAEILNFKKKLVQIVLKIII